MNYPQQRSHYDDDDDHSVISQTHKIDEMYSFANTLSISTGISRQINKNQVLELNAFYERGTGGQGVQLFGLRTSLWFKVK